jgi:hypothetical protein
MLLAIPLLFYGLAFSLGYSLNDLRQVNPQIDRLCLRLDGMWTIRD